MVIEFDKVKEKATEVKDGVKDKFHNAGLWVLNHTNEIVVLTPTVVAGLGLIGKVVKNNTTRMNVKHETEKREKQIYDPRNGIYVPIKRKLTTDEIVALANRPKEVSVTQMLDMFGVIK